MASEKTNNRVKGILATIMFHLVLLAAFAFYGLSTPLPLPGEEGVEVNLGSNDAGSGSLQQEEPGLTQVPTPEPEPPEEQVEEQATEEVEDQVEEQIEEQIAEEQQPEDQKPEEDVETTRLTEEDIETQEIEETVKAVEEKPNETREKPAEQPKVNPRAMYKGNSGTGARGSNEGETGEPGDQGRETGDPLTTDHDGLGGKGNGISYSLGDRGALTLSEPPYDSPEQGKVVVTIWVNKKGQVVKAVTGAKGTNIADPRLRQLARDAALRSSFTPDPKAPDLQKGSITYNFLRIH
jgi:outer membrane biosynthesis protein TonB